MEGWRKASAWGLAPPDTSHAEPAEPAHCGLGPAECDSVEHLRSLSDHTSLDGQELGPRSGVRGGRHAQYQPVARCSGVADAFIPPLAQGGPGRFPAPSPRVLASPRGQVGCLESVVYVLAFSPCPAPTGGSSLCLTLSEGLSLALTSPFPVLVLHSLSVCCPLSDFCLVFPSGKFVWSSTEAPSEEGGHWIWVPASWSPQLSEGMGPPPAYSSPRWFLGCCGTLQQPILCPSLLMGNM